MSASKSRFGSLAQAVPGSHRRTRERNAATPTDAQRRTKAGAGVHEPAAALNAVSETLRDHITRLEAELAQSQTVNTSLHGELTRLSRFATRPAMPPKNSSSSIRAASKTTYPRIVYVGGRRAGSSMNCLPTLSGTARTMPSPFGGRATPTR